MAQAHLPPVTATLVGLPALGVEGAEQLLVRLVGRGVVVRAAPASGARSAATAPRPAPRRRRAARWRGRHRPPRRATRLISHVTGRLLTTHHVPRRRADADDGQEPQRHVGDDRHGRAARPGRRASQRSRPGARVASRARAAARRPGAGRASLPGRLGRLQRIGLPERAGIGLLRERGGRRRGAERARQRGRREDGPGPGEMGDVDRASRCYLRCAVSATVHRT